MGVIAQHRAYRFDDFLVDPTAWALYRDGEELHLEPTVLRLLVYLISHHDRLVPREELMENVWRDTVISDAALSKAMGRLRKALGDTAATHRFIETVHSLGYRFSAEVVEVETEGGPGAIADDVRTEASGLGVVAAIAAAVLVVLLILFWPQGREPAAPPAQAIESLAVLPLANLTGDPGEDSFVAGLQDALIAELSRNGSLRVISRRSTMRYAGSDLPMPAIAGELGVDALVEGSVTRSGDRLLLTAQLIDGASDAHLWAQSYEEDARRVLGLVARVASDIAGGGIGGSGAAPADPPGLQPLDPAASRAYLEGLHYLNRFGAADFRRAIELFRQAVALEPDFALGWGNLAAAHLMLAYYGGVPPGDGLQRAREAALQALEIDDRFYVGHAAIGWVRLMSRDWSGAEDAFAEALRLNPSDPMALHGQADFLLFQGRVEESLELVRQAQRLDPFTFMSNMPVPVHLFLMRRYDEAVEEMLALQERVAIFPAHWVMAFMYWEQGAETKALQEDRKELQKFGDPTLLSRVDEAIADGDAQAGVRAVAEAMVERSRTVYVDPFMIAITFARAEDRGATLDWLERALDNGSLIMVYLRYWPQFDFLRHDPRYVALTERIGLPK